LALDHSLHGGAAVRGQNPQYVDNAVVPPMSGTGFPFSLPQLLIHICDHLRFTFFFLSSSESESVAVDWADTHHHPANRLVRSIISGLHYAFVARMAVGFSQ
jgi:hypothetical protein